MQLCKNTLCFVLFERTCEYRAGYAAHMFSEYIPKPMFKAPRNLKFLVTCLSHLTC